MEALAPAAEAATTLFALIGGGFTLIVGMTLTVALSEIAVGVEV